jgi:hypothetical protein
MSDTNLLVLAKEFVKLRKEVKDVLLIPVGPKGDDGEQGPRGDQGERGIDGVDGRDGRDGSQGLRGFDGRDGKDGKDGVNGLDGNDGVSVTDAEVDFDGHLWITLSDGRVIDAGEVKSDNVRGDVFVSGGNVESTGGSSATYGEATIDFGVFPGSNEASIAVTGQTTISATSKVEAFVMGDDTTSDHTANDHRYFAALVGLTCGTPVAGSYFEIHARCIQKLQGTFKVRWVWAD